MLQKTIKFLDNHRFLLVLLLLILFIILFFIVSIFIFFNYNFKPLACTKNIDENTCYHDNIKILKEPQTTKETIFKNYAQELQTLKTTYNLPEFNYYTAYYYTKISELDYEKNKRNETLYEFFTYYSNTYNLTEFYQTNNLFYEIFYPYKIG